MVSLWPPAKFTKVSAHRKREDEFSTAAPPNASTLHIWSLTFFSPALPDPPEAEVTSLTNEMPAEILASPVWRTVVNYEADR